MQREGINDQQSTTMQTVLGFSAQIVRALVDAYTADVNNRPTLAAIEAQAIRDERRDMLVYESMQSAQSAIEFSNSHRGYIVQSSGETDSDSD